MEAVIFDRDGIIIDSESINIASAVETFKKLGINITKEEEKYIVGRHPEDYKNFFLEKYDFVWDEFRKLQREKYYSLLPKVPFFDKTIKLIKMLHRLKIPLALATSSNKETTLQILKRAKIEEMFEVIITSEDYNLRKPDPEPYIATSFRLNLMPEDCVAIEDSSVGVESAKRAGMKCIAIPNEYTKDHDFSRADLILDSADKIDLKLLNSL